MIIIAAILRANHRTIIRPGCIEVVDRLFVDVITALVPKQDNGWKMVKGSEFVVDVAQKDKLREVIMFSAQLGKGCEGERGKPQHDGRRQPSRAWKSVCERLTCLKDHEDKCRRCDKAVMRQINRNQRITRGDGQRANGQSNLPRCPKRDQAEGKQEIEPGTRKRHSSGAWESIEEPSPKQAMAKMSNEFRS